MIYLVNQHSYKTCNASSGRRLMTCHSPMREKKYTFYFQEISPSPWALEFEPDKTYYVISTSDGRKGGLNQKQGGSCVRHNMKIQNRVHKKKEDVNNENLLPGGDENMYNNNKATNHFQPSNGESNKNKEEEKVQYQNTENISKKESSVNVDSSYKNSRNNNFPNEDILSNDKIIEDSSSTKETEGKNQILIGACIGAGVVTTILIFVLIGHRLYVRRRHNESKKHRSTVVGPTGVQSQVTLLPIRGVPLGGDQRGVARLHSNKSYVTSPPPYQESFLDNRNSFRNNPG